MSRTRAGRSGACPYRRPPFLRTSDLQVLVQDAALACLDPARRLGGWKVKPHNGQDNGCRGSWDQREISLQKRVLVAVVGDGAGRRASETTPVRAILWISSGLTRVVGAFGPDRWRSGRCMLGWRNVIGEHAQLVTIDVLTHRTDAQVKPVPVAEPDHARACHLR
jgi:hypothetical protein